jgi:hypothetical protein
MNKTTFDNDFGGNKLIKAVSERDVENQRKKNKNDQQKKKEKDRKKKEWGENKETIIGRGNC